MYILYLVYKMTSDIFSIQSEFSTMLSIDKEYDKVADIFNTSFGSDNVCISAIFKIDNPTLRQQFDMQKKEIELKRKRIPEVINVFHGTTMDAAKSIIYSGFDPAYSKVAAYGKGTYASTRVKTAIGYCKDVKTNEDTSMVFLCKFLKGKFMRCGSNMIISDADCSGNGGDILVTPYAGGILPEYLICYYAWSS